MKTPVTAFVAGLNEAEKLRLSIPALSFCSEIIYIDLGSVDDSLRVAELAGATRILTVPREKNVESVIAKYSHLCSENWILLCDPDEVFSQGAQAAVRLFFQLDAKFLSTIGAASLPWVFFFKSRPLKGTPWGGIKDKAVLFNRSRVLFSGEVHRGKNILGDAVEFSLSDLVNESSEIQHLWFTDWPDFIEKHRRYLALERGSIKSSFSVRTLVRIPAKFLIGFFEGFCLTRGYRDGFVGLLLSMIWAWYQSMRDVPYPKRKSQVQRV